MKNEKKAEILIETIGLKKFYEVGKVWALGGVDIRIERGDFASIMGPSGCGKSTLLHMLGGVDRPSEGEVRVAGENLADLESDDLALFRREKVGIIFQSFNLLPTLTVLENVLVPVMPFSSIGGNGYREKAILLLKRFGLGEKLNNSPNELSGGQNQRVAIARALINAPDIILADEPTGQLDSRNGKEIMELLQELNGEDGVTIILVTHDEKTAGYAKRKILLRDGLVVSGGVGQAEGRKR